NLTRSSWPTRLTGYRPASSSCDRRGRLCWSAGQRSRRPAAARRWWTDDRLIGKGLERRAHGRTREELHHHDAKHPLLRIDPEREAVDAQPSVHPVGPERLRSAEVCGDLESQTKVRTTAEERRRRQVRCVTGGHQLDRLGTQKPHAVELATVQ